VVPIIIFLILYFTFHSLVEGAIVVLSVPFALIGGIILQKLLGYNFSVAVWVGYIALAGVVVETAIVMITYLKESIKGLKGRTVTKREIEEAVIGGATRRLRPILMTEFTSLIGLIPIMWATGTGADVMKPLATPLIGGQFSALVMLLFVIPIVFSMLTKRMLTKE
jgi:Cu(I)/Ag(I) efflux system membrane protein CusA/SilA